jgi:hypothetical protein
MVRALRARNVTRKSASRALTSGEAWHGDRHGIDDTTDIERAK